MNHYAVLPLLSCLLNPTALYAHSTSEVKPINSFFSFTERSILNVEKPGYLHVIKSPVSLQQHLFVSNFKLFGKDTLFSISNWHKGLSDASELHLEVFNEDTVWPNEARAADPNLFGEEGVIVSGGFLVPGKATGAVTFVPWSNSKKPQVLTKPKKGWFYHRTEEFDVNGDGYLDLITARAFKPMFGKPDGELLWLENPGPNRQLDSESWQEHIIGRGPDVHFRVLPPNDGYPLTIISTEFSAKKLSAFRRNSEGSFDYTLLDETLGSAFDIQLADLNTDGNTDLIVSNHENDEKASVFGYELDLINLKIKARHTLITGIQTKQKGIQAASPGPVLAFHPTNSKGNPTSKPWVLVSGDGSQKAHLLVPEDEVSTHNWKYNEHVIWNPTSTVGQSTVADLDNDGLLEIIIPAYDANKIGVFSILPTPAQ